MLGLWHPAAVAAAPAAQASSAEQNLLAAMKLWGDIKFFDPALSGSVDWDAAFLRAEPAIAGAANAAQYDAAIAAMLAPLHDPATRAIPPGDATSGGGHIRAAALGDATLVTIPHGVGADETALVTDTTNAIAAAAKTELVAIDLRGVTESDPGDATALQYLFAADSPLLALASGSFALPRERSRTYSGYPTQTGAGYSGYSAQDSIDDAAMLAGTSKTKHRFIFLVDANTSLPSMALGLAAAGQGAIYSTGGSPSILAPAAGEMLLPYGVRAAFRLSDLAGIAAPLAFPLASDPAQAIAEYAKAPAGQAAQSPAAASGSSLAKDDPYAADAFPDQAKRMLAIARIYNVIRYFSPYTSLMHDDWDAAATQAISDEAAAADTRSYLLGLMRFYAHLHDSHGYVGGDVMNAEFGAGVPFRARYLHGEVVVTNVKSGEPAVATLRAGDVIDSVNGVAVRRAMDDVEAYISASTPQSADAVALSPSNQYSVFTGKKGTPVTIAFHRAGGHRMELTVTRNIYALSPSRTGAKYFVMPGNVGYVDFDRLEPAETTAMFDALKNTRAIVFDDRGYPKGAAWYVAPRLTTATGVRAALFARPSVSQPIDLPAEDIMPLPNYFRFYQLLPESSHWRYLKPTVMLIDERAISQSEHSALFFRAAARTRFVGTPTDGANGDVTSMVVPGGVSLYFTGEGVSWPNGDQLQRVGIQPDVRVEPSAADIATGTDVVLQKGLSVALGLAGVGLADRNAAVKNEALRERAALNAPPAAQPLGATGSNAQPLALAWSVNSAAYRGSTAASGGYTNSAELSLESAGGTAADGAFGSYSGALDLAAYRGKTVRIRGYLSSDNASGGVGFWLRIDGPSRQFDNMQDRWLTGTSDWKPFAIVLHVPPSATKAFAGLLLVGTGTAHASALTIDIVPDATTTTSEQ
ncbi:MAG TPA: S41 family peptidase [Candidatus Acidoferrales bacterium]|nr:S41 family peptidase [Candidatus Acidoferrales bacterium]